jgi:hypothetical protein
MLHPIPWLSVLVPFLVIVPSAQSRGLPTGPLDGFERLEPDPGPPKTTRSKHYVVSNESRHDLYYHTLRDLGGVYVGVGTDQNYLMAGWARPEILVLMDFDQVIADVHKVYEVIFLEADSPEAFLEYWSEDGIPLVSSLITLRFPRRAEQQAVLEAFKLSQGWVEPRLQKLARDYQRLKVPCFLTDQAQYTYLRQLFQDGRVFAIRGDLTGPRTVQQIADAASLADLPVRVLYLSNSEQYFAYEEGYRQNMLALPFDAHSVVVRTMPCAGRTEPNCYDHFVQAGPNFQAWVQSPDVQHVKRMLHWKRPQRDRRFYAIEAAPPARQASWVGGFQVAYRAWQGADMTEPPLAPPAHVPYESAVAERK